METGEISYPKAILVVEDDKTAVKLEEKQLILLEESNMGKVYIRSQGSLADKAFYLPQCYAWIIVKDNLDNPCLVPLKRA